MTSDQLLARLAAKHSGDVFVAECKDGPTHTRAHRRLDAWVLLKTWSPITTIGYEVKVSLADWRRDAKLHDYMSLCHLLYVVAPKGVVPPEELPAGVGLLEPVGDERLQVKRKAARREIALPGELMVYVLMCRTKVTRERDGYAADPHWRTAQLRAWVEGKQDRQGLSSAVSRKIRQVFERQQSELEAERRRHDALEAVAKRIAELGFDVNRPIDHWSVRARLDEFNVAVDLTTLHQMRTTAKTLEKVADTLERLKRARAGTAFEEEITAIAGAETA